MVRFIHTSDLHLGKRFGQLPEELRGRLTEARHQSIETLASLARSHSADFIVVAGDIFDTGTPSPSVIRQALQAMAKNRSVRWVLMPGNHDSLASDELWKQMAGDRPENVILGLESKPLEVDSTIYVLPAPCLNRRPGRDLTEWMSDVDLPAEIIRIGLGHSAVQNFGEEGAADIIEPDRAQLSGLDYLALGDWHGQIAINDRTWYSGTPEQDRFKHAAPGKALLVSIEARNAIPIITPLETGRFEWLKSELQILPGEDAKARLDAMLPETLRRRETLLQVIMEGRMRLPVRIELEAAFQQAEPDFALLEPVFDNLKNDYAVEDLDQIDQAGALRQAADVLLREAEANPSGTSALALSMLYGFASEEK